MLLCVFTMQTESVSSSLDTSVSKELHDSHCMDFHEVSHLGFVLKSLDKPCFWIKLDNMMALYTKTYIQPGSLAMTVLYT